MASLLETLYTGLMEGRLCNPGPIYSERGKYIIDAENKKIERRIKETVDDAIRDLSENNKNPININLTININLSPDIIRNNDK